MEVEDPLTAGADALENIRFFDIHVESIQQQPKIIRTDAFNQGHPFRHRIDQGRFVAVDRLQSEPDAKGFGSLAAFLQSFANPSHALFLRNAGFDNSS